MTQIKKKKGLSFPLSQETIKLHAVQSKALDVYCYRGFAKLSDLAKISNADEYHPTINPSGIQRELNKKHAREAYNYASKEIPGEKRIWPEIILNLRSKDGVKVEGGSSYKHMPQDMFPVQIKIDLQKINRSNINPTFSRVDGNHRLYYAAGIDKKHPCLNITVPFCIINNVSKDEEKLIFKTINETQAKLKTDHILRIKGQLTPDEKLMEEDPVLWLTHQMRGQQASPFYGLVYIAGQKERSAPYIIKQTSLYDGIRILYKELDFGLKKLENLRHLSPIIIRYFTAVKKKWSEEWMNPKGYLLMTNTGMQALGFVGAYLIDKQVKSRQLNEDDFYRELKGVDFSWKQIKGEGGKKKLQTGRAGGEMIAGAIKEQISGFETNLEQLLRETGQ